MKIKDYKKQGKTFVIAEIGQAHDGSFGILESLTKSACISGVDAVKFQVHIADAESSEFEPFRKKFSFIDKNRIDYWRRMELSFTQWKRLKNICKKHNVEFLATPFSIEAIDLLEKLGVSKYKVGSGDTGNKLLLKKLAQTTKEVIISSGMSTLDELAQLSSFLVDSKIQYSLLHCVSKYPTAPKDINLHRIIEMSELFDCPIGFSDHSGKIPTSLAAVSLGACIIEVHCTFDKDMFGPDSSSSLTFEQLSELVQGIRFLEKALKNKNAINRDDEITRNKIIFGKSYI